MMGRELERQMSVQDTISAERKEILFKRFRIPPYCRHDDRRAFGLKSLTLRVALHPSDIDQHFDVRVMIAIDAGDNSRDKPPPVHEIGCQDNDENWRSGFQRRHANISFQSVAVTPQQIEEWNLPSRPTKRTDSRAKRFGYSESVELDAIEPHQLRALVEGAIT